MTASLANTAEPADVRTFVGYQLWLDLEGVLRMTLFLAGRMIELIPDDETRKQPPGLYDLEHNPVSDPL